MVRGSRAALLFCLTLAPAVRAADATRLWTQQVQPLFDAQCVKCHGPIYQNSELELDTPAAVLRGGAGGEVVTPGRPDESPLFAYLAADSDPHMPPEKQLSDEQIGLVERWIVALAGTGKQSQDETPLSEPAVAGSFATPTEAIDALIANAWRQSGVAPAPLADDRTWCRRVYLDLAGRIPTRDEVEAFVYDGAATKRRDLVDRLLESDSYPVRMRELWDAHLMGRGRQRHEGRRRKSGWWDFLELAFRENRPWNQTVREMLVARPQTEATRGAAWFLYERRNRHQEIAEAVAPIVYGTKIDCAQCHDHPLVREIKQAHYWGLVAAFNRSKNVDGDGFRVEESAVGGFVNFTNLEKESQPAKVMLLTGGVVDETWPDDATTQEDSDDNYVDPKAAVKIPKYSRRAAFAELATIDNPLLARAFVNRVWATFLGRGIVHPVDQMNARNPPSHPELLDWLAADFIAHGYDARRLIRGVVLSRAYGLSAHAVENAPPWAFTAAIERPLMAEQIARSWRVALGLSPDDDELRRKVIESIPAVSDSDGGFTFRQAQFLAGAESLIELLRPTPGGVFERVSAIAEPASRVREAFLAVYGRWPTEEEANRSMAFLQSHTGAPEEGFRDLLWALLTSTEFLTAP